MNEQPTCRELVERMTDPLELAVDAPLRQRLQKHLADCEGCHIYFAQILVITRSLSRLPPEPAGARSRKMRRLLTEAYRRRSRM